jgi:hypothetical protein
VLLDAGTHESHDSIKTGWVNGALDRARCFRILGFLLDRLGIRRTT